MKSIRLVILLVFCAQANAVWVEDSIVYDINSKEPMAMAEALANFPDALTWMNAHALTGASRLKVVQVVGRVAEYRWENDSNCSVVDPIVIPKIRLYNVTTDYIYEADPGTVWQLLTTTGQVDPCAVGPTPLTKNVVRKK